MTGVDLVQAPRDDCSVADIRDPNISDLVPEDIDAIVKTSKRPFKMHKDIASEFGINPKTPKPHAFEKSRNTSYSIHT